MESIFKKLDRIGTKVTDVFYKDKWDRSCLNPALLASAEENSAGVKNTHSTPVPVVSSSAINSLPIVEPSQSISSIAETESVGNIEDTIIQKVIEDDSQSEKESTLDHCYYVLIRHTKKYEGQGNLVLVSSCDYERVWSNDQPIEKPEFAYCPKCGRKVTETETEME